MKLHFEADLSYQAAAIEAVCDLFRGQEVCRSVFTVTAPVFTDAGPQRSFEGKAFTENGGIGNALQLIDFTVEMETGTGKTYRATPKKYPVTGYKSIHGFILIKT